MVRRLVLAFAAFSVSLSAAAAPQEPKSMNPDPYSPDRKQVTMDNDQASKFMDAFARCVASNQPRKAAAVLALPYGSKEQLTAAANLATKEYDCLGPYSGSVELGFDAPSLASGMAEYFLINPSKVADVRRRDPSSFVYSEPAGIEVFGECVVGQNPTSVETLAKSTVGSSAESIATDALTPELEQCVSERQTLALNRTALRQLLTVSLYKHVVMPPTSPASAAAVPTQH